MLPPQVIVGPRSTHTTIVLWVPAHTGVEAEAGDATARVAAASPAAPIDALSRIYRSTPTARPRSPGRIVVGGRPSVNSCRSESPLWGRLS